MKPNCVRYSTGRKVGTRRHDEEKLAADRQADGPRGGMEERKEEWGGGRDAGIPDQTVLSSPLRVL